MSLRRSEDAEPKRTIFEEVHDGSGQVFFYNPPSLFERLDRLLRTGRDKTPRLKPPPVQCGPASLQHLCIRVMSRSSGKASFRAEDAAAILKWLDSMELPPTITECQDYFAMRKRLQELVKWHAQASQTKQANLAAEKEKLREEEEAKRQEETATQHEHWEDAEAEASEWRRRQDKEAFAARETARRAREQEALRKAPISLSQALRRGASVPVSSPATEQRASPSKRPNPFAAQQPPSKRPAPLPTAFHCPEPAVEPARVAPRPTPRSAPSAKRASTAASRGTRKQRVPWSAREERALRDALKQGMHGQWEEILRRPEWCDALSRRTGENLKDKARNLK